MCIRVIYVFGVSLICCLVCFTDIFAIGRARRTFVQNNQSYSNSVSDSDYTHTKRYPTVDVDKELDERGVGIDNARVELSVPQEEKFVGRRWLFASVEGFRLNKSSEKINANYRIEVTESGKGYVDISNLQPESIYEVQIKIWQDDNEFDRALTVEGSKLIRSVSPEMHIVTTGVTKLSRVRGLIVARALSELRDWKRGAGRGKPYMGNRGGWCDQFYCWVVRDLLKVNYPSDTSSFFRRHRQHGAEIDTLAEVENISGNNGNEVQNPAHRFMVLAYDETTGDVWTVEGNFNNSVKLYKREPSEFYHAHLTEEMLVE